MCKIILCFRRLSYWPLQQCVFTPSLLMFKRDLKTVLFAKSYWTLVVSDDLNTFHRTSFYLRLILFGVLAVVLTLSHLNHIRLLTLCVLCVQLPGWQHVCMYVLVSAPRRRNSRLACHWLLVSFISFRMLNSLLALCAWCRMLESRTTCSSCV